MQTGAVQGPRLRNLRCDRSDWEIEFPRTLLAARLRDTEQDSSPVAMEPVAESGQQAVGDAT